MNIETNLLMESEIVNRKVSHEATPPNYEEGIPNISRVSLYIVDHHHIGKYYEPLHHPSLQVPDLVTAVV